MSQSSVARIGALWFSRAESRARLIPARLATSVRVSLVLASASDRFSARISPICRGLISTVLSW
nr:MAG TPA: hypothetical protein [Caudoviricetes sp.]